MLDDTEVQQIVQQAESLLDKVERLEDEQARIIAVSAVRALMTLYGEALDRIVSRAGKDDALLQALAGDELISHLLLVHDLHPVPVEERIRRALQALEEYLQSQAATAELVGVGQGVATVRLTATPGGGRKVHETLQRTVLQAAPELAGVQVDDASVDDASVNDASVDGASSRAHRRAQDGFIPLDTLAPLQESESNG